ncbi:UreD urease accessory protein-domain-containing protein [Kickxella alabastrina]|uniref:UreD urease accessory protein-domain-containing protein n=1 Tax=Kickxella alabastrina TaxID=61397 RepID=UPI002220601C|nr:UreD urease accessory protein-domain-containing protein [Kickxella alabastrina]KAI7822089.1 UreD urease accessory protein-domain-containing protein [Kickxella alabastrina]
MPAPGEGRISCQVIAGRLYQTHSSAYPLKIISPQAHPDHPQSAFKPCINYILSYGGGIVHGDRIHINAHAGKGCALIMLTQGSTKVYRHRKRPPPNTQIVANNMADESFQTLILEIDSGALVCLLPDPVTCFRDARYNQRQAVRMQPGSSLVLLDWMTSGRMSRGERWDFQKYFSVNLITHHPTSSPSAFASDSVGSVGLENVDAFAFILVLGPAVTCVAEVFKEEHNRERVRPFRSNGSFHTVVDSVKWSVSEVDQEGVLGVAVRACGPSTEELKAWIKRRLELLQNIIGQSAWSMYFNA